MMINITYNEKTIEVNPDLMGLPSEVLSEFGEKTHNQATIHEYAKNYFSQKTRSESFAHPSITFIAISLAVATAIIGIAISGCIFFSVPPLGLLLFYTTLAVSAMLGAWAAGNINTLDARNALPQSEKWLRDCLADNIAFMMKDHTEIKRSINDRINKIETIINNIKGSDINSKNQELINLKLAYESANNYLESDTLRAFKARFLTN